MVVALREEIEAKRRGGGNWRWDHFISKADMQGMNPNDVCSAVGCWEYGDDPDHYHFYTNRNHSMWRSW